jgi:hypothetical protein
MHDVMNLLGRQRYRVAVLGLSSGHCVPHVDGRDIRLLGISFLKK